MRRVMIILKSILLVLVLAFACFLIVLFTQKEKFCVNGKCTEYRSYLQKPMLVGKFHVTKDESSLMPLHISGIEERGFVISVIKSGRSRKMMNVQVIHNGEKWVCIFGEDSVSHESPLSNSYIYGDTACVFNLVGDDYVRISYSCPKCENNDSLAIDAGWVPLLSPMIIDLKSYLAQHPQDNKTTINSNQKD